MDIKEINRRMCQAQIREHFDKLKGFQKGIHSNILISMWCAFLRGELTIYKLSYNTVSDYNFCVHIEEEIDKIEGQNK